ncbi:MAG: glycosyltransferase family 2 protein [Patescibacteria group bacterium]
MKLNIGFLTYNLSSFKYLPAFFSSLMGAVSFLKDNYTVDVKITAVDNSVNFDGNYNYLSDYVSNSFELIKSGGNIGFAKGFNLIINRAVEESFDIFLVINPDVILEKDSLYKMVNFLNSKSDASSVSPVILRWDFGKKEKSNKIDSLGIGIKPSHKFFDIGQGNYFNNYENLPTEIFGPSGACALFKLDALKKVAYYNGEYLEFFDELMFMYKEDIDLSYRLQLASFKSYLVKDAFIYHDRSLSSKTSLIKHVFGFKRDKSRSWSFLNQLILNYKFSKIKFPLDIKLKFFVRNLLLFFYGFLFELRSFFAFINIKRQVKKRVNSLTVENTGLSNLLDLIKN